MSAVLGRNRQVICLTTMRDEDVCVCVCACVCVCVCVCVHMHAHRPENPASLINKTDFEEISEEPAGGLDICLYDGDVPTVLRSKGRVCESHKNA